MAQKDSLKEGGGDITYSLNNFILKTTQERNLLVTLLLETKFRLRLFKTKKIKKGG